MKINEDTLKRIQVGQSFFVECQPSSLNNVRRLAYKLGMKVAIRKVHQDEIYGTPGTRVFRLK